MQADETNALVREGKGKKPPVHSRRFVLLFLGLHFAGAIAHGTAFGLTAALGRVNADMPIYKLKPIEQNTTSADRFTRVSTEAGSILPTQIVMLFYSVSIAFHTLLFSVLAISLMFEGVADWYLDGLLTCTCFTRWLEYFFSASIMMVLCVRLLGQAELYALVAAVALMAVTQVFGFVTELFSSLYVQTLDETDEGVFKICGYDLRRRWKSGTRFNRLLIHFAGYFPYSVSWFFVFDAYAENMRVIGSEVPAYTHAMVFASFAIFSFFGFVQLANQLADFGPSWYWLCEVAYIVLSFVAKAELGLLVLFQVLIPDAKYDTFLQIRG